MRRRRVLRVRSDKSSWRPRGRSAAILGHERDCGWRTNQVSWSSSLSPAYVRTYPGSQMRSQIERAKLRAAMEMSTQTHNHIHARKCTWMLEEKKNTRKNPYTNQCVCVRSRVAYTFSAYACVCASKRFLLLVWTLYRARHCAPCVLAPTSTSRRRLQWRLRWRMQSREFDGVMMVRFASGDGNM